MFLKYSSYAKTKINHIPNEKNKISKQSTLFPQDEDTFTDFFIRHETHSPPSNTIRLNHQKHTNQPSTKTNNFLQLQQQQTQKHKLSKGTIFCLPPKKPFDIKNVTQSSKSKNFSPFRSLLKKQNSSKLNAKKQHLNQRKLQPFLSLKGSARYRKQVSTVKRNNSQSIPSQLKQKSNSYHLSVNLTETNTNEIDELNKQKRQKNLLSAYKIKSLILERNPKEQILQKTRKYLRKEIDKKPLSSLGGQDAEKTQSERHYKKLFKKQLDQSRFTTTQRKDQKIERMDISLSLREKQNVRFCSPRQNAKINLKPSSKKQFNLFAFDDNLNNKESIIEPWVKNEYEQDIFSDSIQQIEIQFQPFQRTLDNAPDTLMSLNMGHRTTRNTHRKMFSTKQNTKFNKITIQSQK